MKLFYLQPDGHGPTSYFVMAETAEDAAAAINAERASWAVEGCGGKFWDGWGDAGAVKSSELKEAAPGEVLTNDNA
jgi:hypothetical protein